MDDAPEDVRQAKTRLIALLQACGHRGKMADCVMDAVFALARKYFALERTESPLIEILADGENRVLKVETY